MTVFHDARDSTSATDCGRCAQADKRMKVSRPAPDLGEEDFFLLSEVVQHVFEDDLQIVGGDLDALDVDVVVAGDFAEGLAQVGEELADFRVLVMHEGRITGELTRPQLSEEAVMQLATGSTAEMPG